MNYNGQSLNDRLQAARHTLLGSSMGRAVCKATTEELGAPKKKHLDYLKQCTYETNVSIPQLVELLIDRTRTNNWIVTFKALITIHYLLNNGNERFGSCFASCGHKLNLCKFFDRSNLIGFEMSSYIRKYAAYIDSKREIHRLVGHDLCRAKRGDDGFLRKLSIEKLFRTLKALAVPIENLLQFKLNKSEMVNSIMITAYRMLSKDALRLYACYNDGVISLLEKFFDLPKKECADALELYRIFLTRSEQLAQFLKNSEQGDVDRSGLSELVQAPSSLMETLQSHYMGLSGSEHQSTVTNNSPNRSDPKFAVPDLSGKNPRYNNDEKLMALEDEAKAMKEFSKRKQNPSSERKLPSYSVTSEPPTTLAEPISDCSLLNTSTGRDLLELDFGWSSTTPSSKEQANRKQVYVSPNHKDENTDLLGLVSFNADQVNGTSVKSVSSSDLKATSLQCKAQSLGGVCENPFESMNFPSSNTSVLPNSGISKTPVSNNPFIIDDEHLFFSQTDNINTVHSTHSIHVNSGGQALQNVSPATNPFLSDSHS